MFNSQQGTLTSLDFMASDFKATHGLAISKQALDERFNSRSVMFLKKVLSIMLTTQYEKVFSQNKSLPFKSCRVRDSTRFKLPEKYENVYRGHGGVPNSNSVISIQYEFDLLTGKQIDIQLTSARRNDQQDSKESINNISQGELLIRDLGYVTTTYLKSVVDKGAYFLNRIPSQISAYDIKTKAEVNFNKVFKKMKRYNLPYMEMDIELGKKARIPCRMIVFINDHKTYKSRLRRTTKNTKSINCKVSDKQKTRLKMDIYITNASKDIITSDNIKSFYSLRWQIELIFKTWKSLVNINKVKNVKIERFQSMLLAALIWILANWKIFNVINTWLINDEKNKTVSIWKFFRFATYNKRMLQEIIFRDRSKSISSYLEMLISIAKERFYRETRKGQEAHIHKIIRLYTPLA